MKYILCIVVSFTISIPLLHAQDTIEVSSGWNMIGSILTSARNEITSEPAGIITSYFYEYKSGVGYQQVDTLKKGKGFWVKVSQSGILLWGTSSYSCPATVVYSGKTYNTVLIGTQCWFKENLDVGVMILESIHQTNNSTVEKYCYDDNITNCTTYGGLYQWDELMQYSTTAGAQGLCPTDWHIPTYGEFQMLQSSVGSDANALKAIGQGADEGAGTNTSGFSALLAGGRDSYGGFGSLGQYVRFWTSTEFDLSLTYHLNLDSESNISNYNEGNKGCGYSVRCLKD